MEKDEVFVYKLVGHNLKRIRREKGLSIVKLAMMCHYSEGFIRNIESPNYIQTFSLGTLWNFAQVLDIDIKEFFIEQEEN